MNYCAAGLFLFTKCNVTSSYVFNDLAKAVAGLRASIIAVEVSSTTISACCIIGLPEQCCVM